MAAHRTRSGGTRRIDRLVFADGSFLEGSITQFDTSAQQPAGVDYRLAYIAADGTVRVLYDNQAGHPPHRHVAGKREPYAFVNVEQLVDDFMADVARLRRG